MKTQRCVPTRSLATRNWTSALVVSTLLAFTPRVQAAAAGYVAHEWGTFTSIQGGDGVLLNWNGIATAELPPFVYNWSRPGLQRFSTVSFAKGGISSLQRMETPVIYFYAKSPLNVDVAVKFPQGQITEWFPQAAEAGPSSRQPGGVLASLDNAANRVGLDLNPSIATRFGEPPVTNSIIRWKDFEVLPAQPNRDLASRLPSAARASHYFAARETDAAFVRVDSLESTNPAPEIEKFLFYRGVGNFQTPLKVTMNEEARLTVTNCSDAPLHHLFAVEIRGGGVSAVSLGNLEPGQARETHLGVVSEGKTAVGTMEHLRRQMADALVAEGLYRAEAEAMVETWRDAWFEDQGVRILYILPRAWTDSILPITLTPHPRELVRVMVGRAEVISPVMEQQVANCIKRFRQSDLVEKEAAIRDFQAMKLGRFAEVAIRLVAARTKDDQCYSDGAALIQAAAKASAGDSQPARRLAAKGG